MLVKTTFFTLLAAVIAASSAIPVPQAADAAPSASASADPANLDPLPESSSIEAVGLKSVPTPSSVAPLPSSTHVPPKHEPTPIHQEPPKHEPPVHHTTSTFHHIPVHTPVYPWQPPVHQTTTLHHVPVHTPVWHAPPVHHSTTLHHVPVYTPIYHEPPVHHTTNLHHIPVHTPIYYEPPVHHTTTFHHVPVHTPTHHELPVHYTTTLEHHAPVHSPVHVPVHVPKHHSFDRWGGYDSLKDFDHFYGVDNWDGYKFEQVFVKKEHELVCKVHEVHIIQQRLLVLQEMAKRVIVEGICETEVQTIVFEQWYAGLHGFGRDLRRYPGHHQVAYDEEIIKHFPKFIKHEDGSLNLDDWHFTGKDLGRHSVVVKGHNWDDKRSPSSVWKAWGAARQGWYDLYGKWF